MSNEQARVCNNLGGQTSHGEWIPVSDAIALANNGNAEYGVGTHWVQTRKEFEMDLLWQQREAQKEVA